MNFLAFTFFSILELLAVLIFILVVFRIELKYYVFRIGFVSISIPITSYVMRVYFDLGAQVASMYLILMLLAFWIFFKFHIFYAALMTLLSLLYLNVVQFSELMILDLFQIFNIEDIRPLTFEAYAIQFIFFAFTLILSIILARKRIGFTFIPFTNDVPLRLVGINLLILIVLVIIAIIFNMSAVYFAEGFSIYFVIITIVAIIALISLVYLAIRREQID
ncbi:hypothetical protein [Marinicrinis sediminis]|uniref:Uncharacterized protein n=1 Tax=Marinicrinis sediminis TaxID=1652465 RepID=A0ABW5R9N5_9BACL